MFMLCKKNKMREVIDSEGSFPTTKYTDNSLYSGIHVLMKRQMSERISVSKA